MASGEHPYAEIISKFKPNEWQLEKKEAMKPKPLDDTPVTIVDSGPLLYELVGELKQCKEIAISIYHNTSSFRGDIALIVFSTRNEEFVVDPINMRDQMAILNEIFVCTDILKVMFINVGSKNENRKTKLDPLQRLQRDFGLYIVNLFDLGYASQALEIRKTKSDRAFLSICLKDNFGIDLDEEYMKDFVTTRPLTPEVIRFVGEETHYLLSLYDVFRNKLIEREKPWYADALTDVYKKCAASSALLWCPDNFELKPDAFKNHLSNEKFNPTQTECFRLVHDWRWKVAGETDKQLKDVMATEHMKKIAQALPTTSERISACCQGDVSEVALTRIDDIRLLVLKAMKSYPKSILKGQTYQSLASETPGKYPKSILKVKTEQTMASQTPVQDTAKEPSSAMAAKDNASNQTVQFNTAPQPGDKKQTSNTATPSQQAQNKNTDKDKNKHFTSSTYGQNGAPYGPTRQLSGFGGPMSGFGGPMSGFGGPMSGFGGPMSGFGGPMSGFGGPMSGFGGPMSGFGGPMGGFGGSMGGFGGHMGCRPVTGFSTARQIDVLMNALQGMIGGENGRLTGFDSGRGRGRGRFRPYHN